MERINGGTVRIALREHGLLIRVRTRKYCENLKSLREEDSRA